LENINMHSRSWKEKQYERICTEKNKLGKFDSLEWKVSEN